MNKYRSVEYTDDGCTLYQCLKCKGEWESRSSPEWSDWKWCPMCGTKWEGKHETRPHGMPRWVYERWGAEGIPYETHRKLETLRQKAEEREPVVIIESKHGSDPWRVYSCYLLKSARRNALDSIELLRQEDEENQRRHEELSKEFGDECWRKRTEYRFRSTTLGELRSKHGPMFQVVR